MTGSDGRHLRPAFSPALEACVGILYSAGGWNPVETGPVTTFVGISERTGTNFPANPAKGRPSVGISYTFRERIGVDLILPLYVKSIRDGSTFASRF